MPSFVQVSNLDFQDIKTALKEYLRAQSDFTSYDFEGSAMSVLLDVLAYNTYYTAFNTNMVVNELFLDSATLRDNVVSLAKQLGYKPKSRTAPVAKVSFSASYGQSSPTTALFKKGTGFTTTFDDTLYSFVAIDDHTAPVSNSTAVFTEIPVYEGTLIENNYIVDTSIKQRFIIQNANVDISSLRVRVFASDQSTAYLDHEYSDNILNVGPDSPVFFVDEIEDERYEIFFGDGVIGRALENGEQIEISYLITNGASTNGAKNFTWNGVLTDIFYSTGFPVSVSVEGSVAAEGGAEIESISQIKYNAPKYFSTQDRAVTSDDYAAIVRNIYPAISDIITFGGEEDDPPEYGKVKIVIKPESSNYLSNATKKDIAKKLKPYMVASVIPDIIDASILYVEVNSSIYYDSSRTTQRPEQVQTKVKSSLESYLKQSQTEKFNGKFRYSKFVSTIDNSDSSINSNTTSLTLRKDFFPQLNSKSYYEICYQNRFDEKCEGPVVTSTGFKVSEFPTYTVYLEDNDGAMVLYRLDRLTGDKITLNDSVGTVNYEKGEVQLYDLTIVQGSFSDNKIELRALPMYDDIVAMREVYLDVDMTSSKFTAYPE